MKKAKKLLCVLMAALMFSFVLPFAAWAEGDSGLQFNEDGKFTIMMFADIQDDENVEETTLQLMNEALDKYQPDLVVYMGDNTVAKGYDAQHQAIEAITKPCVDRNVPYAIVFGNHDQEQGVDKEDLLAMYQEFGCLTYDAAPEIYGVGTCNLPILSSDGTRTAFNLWLTDSGSRNEDKNVGGYDYVHKDQVEWYKAKAEELKEANGGEYVPSMNFQHIVVPEVYEAMYPKFLFTVGETYTIKGTTYIPVPGFSLHTGFILEPPCPPYVTEGQFDAWVETGDVIASFFGHDHINSYTVGYKGIDLTCVPTVGCNSYSNELNRGVGLLTLDENNPENYEYQLINMFDMALAEGSRIPNVNGGHSKLYYMLMKFFFEMFTYLHNLFLASPFGK